ncbi:lipo-like protein [Solemya velum gill symbiont]|nr:YiiX/YebB-like N1pC/P60 family cysteine hydrolase [Solemya velum gill symbiont]OOZ72322.1 lipo-like protein [Solemya velum gill symbiont]
MNRPFQWLGRNLAEYLNTPITTHRPHYLVRPQEFMTILRPGDVLLVEGNTRISTAIKYLTQSTWSHSALFIGNTMGQGLDAESSPTLVEADITKGVITLPLSRYEHFSTRICRPINLSKTDCERVINYAVSRIGHSYDLKNVFDLARYLLPTPPVPSFMRRRMLALGSGDPTRAICSTLIAQAFQSVHYPILPIIEKPSLKEQIESDTRVNEIHHIRHHSLFTPCDFDLSPYFQVIKPTQELGFDYKALTWNDQLKKKIQLLS